MDPDRPSVQAVAIRDGVVAAAGDNSEIAQFIGDRTRVVELAGRGVTPGLVDGHGHVAGLGQALESVDLRGAKSEADAVMRVRTHNPGRESGEWITGRGWDQNLWDLTQFPTHDSLDRDLPGIPVALRRIDGHALWASGEAMRIAGVTAATKDPSGGLIVRNQAGEPTGVFVDNAMSLIEAHVPPPSATVLERQMRKGMAAAIAVGLTGVHDMGVTPAMLDVYLKLAEAGQLPLRVQAFLAGTPDNILELTRNARIINAGNGMLTVRSIKMYADGALGSRGAALLEPYSDDAHNRGLWVSNPKQIARAAMIAAHAGWQLGIHAIGDAANRAVLDAYEAAYAAHPGADLRFRIEHAQVVAADDLPRFAKIGVIASMQPTHATSDMPWAETRLGSERIRGAYAWRTLLDSGAPLVAGSDFPVERPEPLHGLFAAVSRQDRSGQPEGGWRPEQRMSLDEAVRAFTVGAAYASFNESSHGRIRRGYVADITVYDRPLATNQTLLSAKIDMTIVAGRIVSDASNW